MDPGSREDLPPTTLVVRMCSITGLRPQAAGFRSAPSGEKRGGDSHQQELPQPASVSQPAGGDHCAGVVCGRCRLETLPQTPTTEGILAESRASPTETDAGSVSPMAYCTAPSAVEDWHCRDRPGRPLPVQPVQDQQSWASEALGDIFLGLKISPSQKEFASEETNDSNTDVSYVCCDYQVTERTLSNFSVL
ncbi:hypothetical protein STEG23_006115 [Scotinomys teguina]